MKAVKTYTGQPAPITPDSPEAKNIYLNTCMVNQLLVSLAVQRLENNGYQVTLANTLDNNATPQIKHATLIKNVGRNVARILKEIGFDLPLVEEPLINGYDYGIFIFLIEHTGIINERISALKLEVSILEELARRLNEQVAKHPVKNIYRLLQALSADFIRQDETVWNIFSSGLTILYEINQQKKAKPDVLDKAEKKYMALLERIYIAEHARSLVLRIKQN
jgi:hypothetical protein